MMKHTFTLLLVVGCPVAGTLSSPQSGDCTRSEECSSGMVCRDGECVDPGPNPPPPPAGGCLDDDRDGFFARGEACSGGDDCDDADRDVGPGSFEVCADGVDNDCDGESDEGECGCRPGDHVSCYAGPGGTAGVGACGAGVAVCTGDGTLSACAGQVTPSPESCDQVDNDCNGQVDEGLRNRCGDCAAEPSELCGDEIDNDCDGLVDEECDCDYRCLCELGMSCECKPPTEQPCYEGAYGTGGLGGCHGGKRDCIDEGGGVYHWGSCVGQTLPATECAEGVGANGLDDDCNGRIDDGCIDSDGDGTPAPADCNDTNAAIHPGAAETCNGLDDDCDGTPDEGVTNRCGACGTPAGEEVCDNGLDDNCNARVDEACGCRSGSTQPCYGGPPEVAGIGACARGTQSCTGGEFGAWEACVGDVWPGAEVCDGVDNDCDGAVDERWALHSNACGYCDSTEVCDGMDNDCDGQTDEGLANRCGECLAERIEVCNGIDDDCDGAVDDGVVNACGLCSPATCFVENWDTPAACETSGRNCDGVVEDPDHPGSITLGHGRLDLPLIYIAVSGRDQVAQLNTDTGVKNWQVDTHGDDPSRTAVALDGSVWVANRGTGMGTANPAYSNVVHISVDGEFICRADVTGRARGLAIDAQGFVWAGSYDTQKIWKISGNLVDDGQDPPRCEIVAVYPVPGVRPYGLTVDPNGYLWSASLSAGPVVRMDTGTGAYTQYSNPTGYGIATGGDGKIWFGGTLHALDATTGLVAVTSVVGARGVTVHPDGSVWAANGSTVKKVDPITGAVLCTATPDTSLGSPRPYGLAVDRLGNIWSPHNDASGNVTVWDTDCNRLHTYPVDPGYQLYTYSDMTGHLLRTFTAPQGTWTQDFDSGYAGANWVRIEWDGDVPVDTSVEVVAYAADTPAGLDSATACGAPFTTSPADLSGCSSMSDNRWLRVAVTLKSSRAGARPRVDAVRAYWEY